MWSAISEKILKAQRVVEWIRVDQSFSVAEHRSVWIRKFIDWWFGDLREVYWESSKCADADDLNSQENKNSRKITDWKGKVLLGLELGVCGMILRLKLELIEHWQLRIRTLCWELRKFRASNKLLSLQIGDYPKIKSTTCFKTIQFPCWKLVFFMKNKSLTLFINTPSLMRFKIDRCELNLRRRRWN